MARVKRAVNAQKKRRSILEASKGYRGQRSRLYTKAKEQQLHSARWNVSYHTEHGEYDKKQAEKRTNWVTALRQSLTESSDTSVEA